MGKALILSHIGGGEYSVQYRLDVLRAQTRLTTLQDELANLPQQITDVETDITQHELDVFVAQGELDTILILAGPNIDLFRSLIDAKTREIRNLVQQLNALRNVLIQLRDIRQTELDKEIAYLTANIPPEPTLSIWAVDLTEDLTGEVGTIEIPGERQHLNIRPGFTDQAVHDQARDGVMQPVVSSGGSAVYYNKAILPAWQKWNPQYRKGVITSFSGVDPNLCTIDLDAETSSQQALNVNQDDVLIDVPIVYLDCHEQAFVIGDAVVVEFTDKDFTEPTVIGFVSNPKPCRVPVFRVVCHNTSDNGVIYYSEGADLFEFVVEDVFTGWVQFARTSWVGDGDVVTWWSTRGPFSPPRRQSGSTHGNSYFGMQVNGQLITAVEPDHALQGAAVRKFGTKKYLVAVGQKIEADAAPNRVIGYSRFDFEDPGSSWETLDEVPDTFPEQKWRNVQSVLLDDTGSSGHGIRVFGAQTIILNYALSDTNLMVGFSQVGYEFHKPSFPTISISFPAFTFAINRAGATGTITVNSAFVSAVPNSFNTMDSSANFDGNASSQSVGSTSLTADTTLFLDDDDPAIGISRTLSGGSFTTRFIGGPVIGSSGGPAGGGFTTVFPYGVDESFIPPFDVTWLGTAWSFGSVIFQGSFGVLGPPSVPAGLGGGDIQIGSSDPLVGVSAIQALNGQDTSGIPAANLENFSIYAKSRSNHVIILFRDFTTTAGDTDPIQNIAGKLWKVNGTVTATFDAIMGARARLVQGIYPY